MIYRLVTRTVEVISMDLEHGPKSTVTAIYYCLNKTLLVSFFVHRRKYRDRFRISRSSPVLRFEINET